jgi:pimeloyl-ACP methyl ester carboxylesterase
MTATMNQTIQPQFRTIDGLSIRFAESEDRGDHAVLLNPWPESLFAFEPMWARLAEHAHLVAVDLPGFGHSERRDDLLSPRAMGEFVIRLIDALGLENPHAVGPDIGTSALVFAAAVRPGRLRSLVIGSGGAAYPIQLTGVLKEWIETPDLEGYRSIDPRQIIASKPAAERFHWHAHLQVTPPAAPVRTVPRRTTPQNTWPSLSPGTATGRGDDSEANPYPEAEGPPRP